MVYMGIGGLLGLLTWQVGAVKRPAFSAEQLRACVPLALFHAFTNTLMLTSLAKMAVSLSHTIRARARSARSGARAGGRETAGAACDAARARRRRRSRCS